MPLTTDAKSITVFSQYDSRWASHSYTSTGNSSQTIGTSGCGILAYVNAIYYLNGSFIEPITLADWSVANGHRTANSGTAYALYSSFANSYGSQYGFKYITQISSYSGLISYLQQGCVAVGSVPGHLIAVVDYDSSKGKFLILDSAASSARHTASTGYTWETEASCKATYKLNFSNFFIFSSTTPTLIKEVEILTTPVIDPESIGHIMSESEAAGQTIPDGDYWIYSELNVGYFLDIPEIEKITESGINVEMCHESDYEPSENDIWTVTYLNNGFYQIKQRGTNMCLDVSDGSIYRNANVQLYTENMTNAQQWSVERSEHGYTLQARCSGFYLDIFDARIATGTNVQVYTGNGETWQSWCFIPCNNDERPIEDGTYTLHTVVDTNYSLDASGIHGEYKNGSNVQIWNDNSDPFIVKYIGNGWYKLYEESSGLALDIDNDSEHYMYNNRNAQLYQDISTRAQLWRIRKTSDGHYHSSHRLW